MINEDELLLECNPDEAFMEFLSFTRREIDHQQGKTRIAKRLEEETGLVALIDEDPGKSSSEYFANLTLSNKHISFKNGYRFLVDERRHHLIIELQGRMEQFILRICKKYQVSLNDYGFSGNESKFHGEVNLSIGKFKRLLADIGDVQEFKEIRNAIKKKK